MIKRLPAPDRESQLTTAVLQRREHAERVDVFGVRVEVLSDEKLGVDDLADRGEHACLRDGPSAVDLRLDCG